jgi:hypothetical protein
MPGLKPGARDNARMPASPLTGLEPGPGVGPGPRVNYGTMTVCGNVGAEFPHMLVACTEMV